MNRVMRVNWRTKWIKHCSVFMGRSEAGEGCTSTSSPWASCQRCAPTFELLVLTQLAGEAKVCQLNVHVIIQEDVLRLQVAVHDVNGVQVLNHFQQRVHDLPGEGRQHYSQCLLALRSQGWGQGQG